MDHEFESEILLDHTARIVSAYVGNNSTSIDQVTNLINQTFKALKAAGQPAPELVIEREPAVPIKKSVTPDAITCLDCGHRFKSLRRHLAGQHGLTPEEYRDSWGLSKDYPMTAPNYSAARSQLAKAMGLGQRTA